MLINVHEEQISITWQISDFDKPFDALNVIYEIRKDLLFLKDEYILE